MDTVCKNMPDNARQEPATIAFITEGILIKDKIISVFEFFMLPSKNPFNMSENLSSP